MSSKNKPIANPLVVLREEFDEWAILFDPDSGNAFGLSPIGVFIWKLLDGNYTIEEILRKINNNFEDVSENAKEDINNFIKQLVEQGMVGYEMNRIDKN